MKWLASFAGLLVALGFGLGCGGHSGAATGDASKAMPSPAPAAAANRDAPLVELTALAEYVAGAPILMAVTVENDERDAFYTGLPVLGWLDVPVELQWTLRAAGAEAIVLSDGVLNDEGGGGHSLDHNEKLSMLVDLGTLASELEPGHYEVRIGYPVDDFVPSRWVGFDIVAPTKQEAAALRGVAASADVTPSQGWGAFVGGVPAGALPSIDALPSRLRGRLALHLFVQSAVYGSVDLAEAPLDPLALITDELLLGEREVLRYELLRAREDPAANRVRRAVESKWPGMRWRLDAVDGGYGFLEVQRERGQQRRSKKD